MSLNLGTFPFLCPTVLFLQTLLYQKTPQRNFGRLLWSLQSELLSLLLTIGRESITLYFQNVFWMNSLIYLFIPCTYTVKSQLQKYHTTKSKGSTLSLRSVTLDGLSTLPGSPNPKYVSLERLFYFNNNNYILFSFNFLSFSYTSYLPHILLGS